MMIRLGCYYVLWMEKNILIKYSLWHYTYCEVNFGKLKKNIFLLSYVNIYQLGINDWSIIKLI